jgi:diguanylate cyclase (GGDEF)-like protein
MDHPAEGTGAGIVMTASHWALLALGLLSVALAAAALRLAALLRAARAGSAAELDALRRELSGLEEGRSTLERLSATDPVTGVWNHRYLQDALAREVERARTAGRSFTLLMCDIDRFHRVNAAYGHQSGSAILRDLAQRLALEIRAVDTFARYGGEEFLVLLPDTGTEGAAVVADRLCYAARKHLSGAVAGSRDADPVKLTVSIGAAVFPEDGTHAATLIRAADRSLAAAKEAGGDAWTIRGKAGHPVASHVRETRR